MQKMIKLCHRVTPEKVMKSEQAQLERSQEKREKDADKTVKYHRNTDRENWKARKRD